MQLSRNQLPFLTSYEARLGCASSDSFIGYWGPAFVMMA